MGLKMKRLIDTCVYFNRSLGKLPLPAPPAPPPGGGSVPGGACHADRLSSKLRRGLPPPAGLSPESSTVTLGRTWPGPQPAPPQPCAVCGHAGGGRRGGHHACHGPDPCHARTCPLFSERPRASTLASTAAPHLDDRSRLQGPARAPSPSPLCSHSRLARAGCRGCGLRHGHLPAASQDAGRPLSSRSSSAPCFL